MTVAPRIERLLLTPPALLLFVLPFAHVTAVRSVVLALTVAAALYVWRRDPGPPVPLKLPFALWLGMALVSLLWARSPAYTLGEIRAEIVYGIVYFLAFFALTRGQWHWNVLRGALLAGLVVLSALGAWQYASTGDLNLDTVLGGVLSISSYLVTVLPLLLVGAIEFRRDRRVLALVVAAAIAALLVGYLTFNRAFILAVDACALALAAALLWRHRSPRRLGLAAAAAVALLVVSAAFFYSVAQYRAQTMPGGATVQSTMQGDPRWKVWTYSAGLIREHPFTGTGFGLFAAIDLYRIRFNQGIELANTHAHNPFLNYAVQMGAEGVAVLAFLLFCLFREFWRLWRSDHPQVRLIGAAGLAMMVGVLVKAQPDDLWGRHSGWLFWALTGMMLGYGHRLLRVPQAVARPGAA
jgi:O-antigen ligase